MNKLRTIVLAAALGIASVASAQSSPIASDAGTAATGPYWYNGDWDGVNGLASYYASPTDYALTFDNFQTPSTLLPSATFTVVGGFAFHGSPLAQAYVELRQGMAPANGGTLIYQGLHPMTLSLTGRSGFGYKEYKVLVSFTPLQLALLGPNKKYWLAIAPVMAPGGVAFVNTTSGADNSPFNDGMPVPHGRIPGQAIWHSMPNGFSYEDADNLLGIPGVDFSLGAAW